MLFFEKSEFERKKWKKVVPNFPEDTWGILGGYFVLNARGFIQISYTHFIPLYSRHYLLPHI